MTVIQLTEVYLKAVKRALRQKCDAGSAQLTEAIARGCARSTNAALQAALNGGMAGQYVRFDETAFRQRLRELSGADGPATIDLPPLGRSARYVTRLFENPAVEIIEMHPMQARFRLAGIDAVIEIDLEDIGNGNMRFKRSHAIHTPVQAGPYWPGRDFDDDPAYAMHRAIESIVDYYESAVREGHEPAPGWLVRSHYE
jgi:hypothetical protein